MGLCVGVLSHADWASTLPDHAGSQPRWRTCGAACDRRSGDARDRDRHPYAGGDDSVGPAWLAAAVGGGADWGFGATGCALIGWFQLDGNDLQRTSEML